MHVQRIFHGRFLTMGCSGSKADDLPLVARCRERREFIRAAANHRHALAAAHVSYFRSLKDVADALKRFIDEGSEAPPTPPPPFPKLDSQIQCCESLQFHDNDEEEEEEEESHLCVSDSSSTDAEGNHQFHHDLEKSPSDYSGNVYYMKKSAPPPPLTKTVVPPQPQRGFSNSYWNTAGYGGDDAYFTMPPAEKTPPPPSPNSSAMGLLNRFDVFDMFDDGYGGLFPTGDHENGFNSISPNSSKVREEEGNSKLGEETEHLLCKEALKGKKNTKCSSKSGPLRKGESEKSKQSPLPLQHRQGEGKCRVEQSPKWYMGLRDETPKSVVPKCVSEGSMKKKMKKVARSELERKSIGNAGSSKLSSVTMLSPQGERDLRDMVAEIRDDFEAASGYGKEVAMMLEAGKVPHQPTFLKAILSRILYLTTPWLTFMDSSSIPSVAFASRSVKLSKLYFEDVGKEFGSKLGSLSSTLDKMYAWEKKLYKEVKDEEKLRLMYEKERRRVQILDGVGAESAEVSSIRLQTKLDVCIEGIEVISGRIHKLMDEELQPKIIALIQGMIGMWSAMLRCHQKQFEAISKCKIQNLRVQTCCQKSTTAKLEKELRVWRLHFNEWVALQKSYVESLNGWLLQFHQDEPEAVPHHGPAPYSPGKLGAPPIFVICNDWHKAMEAISDRRLSNAMNAFAASLQKLQGKQDEEEHQRLKVEHVSKKIKKLERTHRVESLRMKHHAVGALKPDDVKLNLDCLRERLVEERTKHNEAMKLVQNAASNGLQRDLIPIIKELQNFTMKALKSHQHIRLQQPILQ